MPSLKKKCRGCHRHSGYYAPVVKVIFTLTNYCDVLGYIFLSAFKIALNTRELKKNNSKSLTRKCLKSYENVQFNKALS